MNVHSSEARDVLALAEEVRMLLDTFLPRYDFAERHSRVIAAPAAAVWEAIEGASAHTHAESSIGHANPHPVDPRERAPGPPPLRRR